MLRSASKNGKLSRETENSFIVPRSLSAMARRFYVDVARPLKQSDWYIKEGSEVTGVKVIAEGEKIREVNRLINKYPLPNGNLTKAADWKKCRGTAIITNGTVEEVKEIHWYQCKNIGKVEFKRKDWEEKKSN